jgi:type VI secretion system protein ImpH
MASHDGGKDRTVNEWLYAEGPRFDFFQAVKLLELAHPPEFSVGRNVLPGREAVRFKSSVRLDFPADDIASFEPPTRSGEPPVMTVNFLGLAGEHGPLPKPVTELILSRANNKDTAFRDFLDIFNHRLVSLLYQIRKIHRFGLDARPPGEDRIARYVYAVLGLGTPALRDQMHDRPLLHYAGLLGQQPRSMAGLERLLTDYFRAGGGRHRDGAEQFAVEGEQFKGRWLRLEEGQRTRLGGRGQNNQLGVDTVLGKHVWDQQGAFELRLGPLTLKQLTDFLPVGWGFAPLCELVRFYVGDELDFSLRLVLKAGERRESRLGAAGGARLGWTAWLGQGKAADAPAEVVVSPDSSARAFPGMTYAPELGLPPDKLLALFDKTKAREFRAGHRVIRQGEAGDSMFLIASGSVHVTRREEDGREVTMTTLRAGDIFGEMSLVAGRARSATVETLEDCKLFELSRQDLEEYIAKHPRVGVALRAFARRRIRKSKRR